MKNEEIGKNSLQILQRLIQFLYYFLNIALCSDTGTKSGEKNWMMSQSH